MTIDVGTSTLTSFVDVDNDGTFNPVAGAPQGTTDWELGRMEVIGEIFLGGPAGDPAIIDGFDGGAPIATATFRPDGTVDNAGAIRLADGRDNFLEVRIAPQGTARIELRKWDDSRPPNEQGSNWYARREGGQAWRWST